MNFQILSDISHLADSFESKLNITGYIPYIGTLTARVRSIWAYAQGIIGTVAMICGGIMLFQANPLGERALHIGAHMTGHSLLNYIRTFFEKKRFLALFSCFPYDVANDYFYGQRIFSYIRSTRFIFEPRA